MKKLITHISLCLIAVALVSCKMELEPYDQPDDHVAFVFERKPDSTIRFTFALYLPEVTERVIELDVTAIGYLHDTPRRVTIRQVMADGMPNAVAGQHYVPFDDPSVVDSYVIKGDTTGVKLPIIIKRDQSMKKQEYLLEITLAANDYFQLGPPHEVVRRLLIADFFTKPTNWGAAANHYLGEWGPVKHRVMVEAAAPFGVIVDDDWIGETISSPDHDYGYVMFWRGIFETRLEEINAEQEEKGLGPLRDEPKEGQSEGDIITF